MHSALRFSYQDPAATEIYTLSLHDALPIWRYCNGSIAALPDRITRVQNAGRSRASSREARTGIGSASRMASRCRSEEHTSELQSRPHLVCRLLLEKKKK